MPLLTAALATCVRSVLIVGLISTVVAAISVGLRFEHSGGHVLSVQTGSMRPAFRPGDAVIAWRVPSTSLRVGTIVSYRSPVDPNVLISHRIVAIDATSGRLTTKGDALEQPDPAVAPQAVIGQVTAVAPGLGSLLSWIRTPFGLVISVYVPATLVVTQQAWCIVRWRQRPGYSLLGVR